MIRGTSLVLNQRQNRGSPQQTRLDARPLQNSSADLERGARAGTVNMLSVQTQSLKLAPPKPVTWPELTNSLETWQDPEDGGDFWVLWEK
ncbi:unnamed protein product [Rotaria sp. Silwood1]|nr:unnamed protein product [Rotaria sp. Silwood1]CAF1560693.1 unnamed protein product [Rotaria sp. Silwood1]CAF3537594.1 unnamed protein product [Rotaria sp. Silwood1]CAF3719066.1 unnamed protein product [Rotaria sp. Silwood1]CAF4791722.1 unnamed protein product [Rotaria sp. Silwood1]